MERTANIDLAWRSSTASNSASRHLSIRAFTGILIACACLSALLASWLPLQVSIATVFLFAGPHNWFELRYFLMRMPVRFGESRNFFLVAFAGIGFLTLTYISLPLLYSFGLWSGYAWSTILASWNTILLLWLGVLVWLRGKQKSKRDWSGCLVVPGSPSATNAPCMAARLSSLSMAVATVARGNLLAVFTNGGPSG